jgi:hypothetical protein
MLKTFQIQIPKSLLRLPAVVRAGRQMSNESQSSVTQGFSLDLDQP